MKAAIYLIIAFFAMGMLVPIIAGILFIFKKLKDKANKKEVELKKDNNLPVLKNEPTEISVRRYYDDENAVQTAMEGISERIKLRSELKTLHERAAYLEGRKRQADLVYEVQRAEFRARNVGTDQELELATKQMELEKMKRDAEYEMEVKRIELEERRIDLEEKRAKSKTQNFKDVLDLEAQEDTNKMRTSKVTKKEDKDDSTKVRFNKIGDKFETIEELKKRLTEIWKNNGYSEEEIEEKWDNVERELYESGELKGGLF